MGVMFSWVMHIHIIYMHALSHMYTLLYIALFAIHGKLNHSGLFCGHRSWLSDHADTTRLGSWSFKPIANSKGHCESKPSLSCVLCYYLFTATVTMEERALQSRPIRWAVIAWVARDLWQTLFSGFASDLVRLLP